MSKLATSITLLSLVLIIGMFFAYQTFQVEGSTITGNDYMATTSYASHPATTRVLKRGFGSLGSVVITGDNTGTMSFYNATTANASARASSKSTSSILIANFPASTPEGTYTFDIQTSDGLLLVVSGAEATGTITYR